MTLDVDFNSVVHVNVIDNSCIRDKVSYNWTRVLQVNELNIVAKHMIFLLIYMLHRASNAIFLNVKFLVINLILILCLNKFLMSCIQLEKVYTI